MKKPPPLRRRKKLVFATIAALIVLLAVEGVCRLFEKTQKTMPSDLLGYEPVPGWRGRKTTINSFGLRGAEVRERTPGTFRILAMGGSTTWGHQLADDETWPFLLSRELGRRGLAGAEVLNGGVSGWGLEQLILALEHRHLPALEIDLVLVFSGWNYPVLEGNHDVLLFRQAAAESKDRNWLHSFAIARWLHRWVRKLAPDLLPEDSVRERLDAATRDKEQVMEEEFPGLCRRLCEVGEQFRVPVVMIVYPGLADLLPPEDDPIYESYAARFRNRAPARDAIPALLAGARSNLEHDTAIVRASARAAGIPLIDVSARMRRRLEGLPPGERLRTWLSYFMDYMHLTVEGNQAFAKAVADELADHGLLPR